jgi:hypothetical protein
MILRVTNKYLSGIKIETGVTQVPEKTKLEGHRFDCPGGVNVFTGTKDYGHPIYAFLPSGSPATEYFCSTHGILATLHNPQTPKPLAV